MMMVKFTFGLYLGLIFLIKTCSSELIKRPTYWAELHSYNKSCFHVKFTQFESLNLLNTKFTNLSWSDYLSVDFHTNQLVLGKKLNVDFFRSDPYSLSRRVLKRQQLTFFGIEGFDVDNEPFEFGRLARVTELAFRASYFYLYSNGRLVDSPECETRHFTNVRAYFGNAAAVTFDNTVKYSRYVCSLIFANSIISTLTLSGLSDHFLKKNIPSFTPTLTRLNATIYTLKLTFYRASLTSSLLDKELFQNLETLAVDGFMTSVQTDVFRSFVRLKTIDLSAYLDLGNLFTKGLDWMNHLNSDLPGVNLTNRTDYLLHLNRTIIINTVGSFYHYPDEDFCYFSRLNFSRLVLFRVNCMDFWGSTATPVTCSQLWLLRYASVYLDLNNHAAARYVDSVRRSLDECSVRNLTKQMEDCKFDDRLRLCDRTNFKWTVSYADVTVENDNIYESKVVTYIMAVIITPVVCSLAIIANLVNILVLRKIQTDKIIKNKKKETIANMMLANSMFNFFYGIVNLTNLMNVCIYVDGVYCSQVYRNVIVQYYRMIVVEFGGNVLKLASDMTYIGVSVNRYMLFNEYSRATKMITKMVPESKTRKVLIILGIVLVMMVMSIDKFFVYMVKSKSEFDSYDDNPYSYVTFRVQSFQRNMNLAFFLLNFVLDDAFLLTVMIIFDVLLIINLRKNLQTIKEQGNAMPTITSNDSTSSTVPVAVPTSDAETETETENFKRMEEGEIKITRTIIVNTTIFTLVKLIELVMSCFVLANYMKKNLRDKNVFCYTFEICHDYEQSFKLFHILLATYSIFMFYHLSNDYKKKFRIMCGKKHKKKSK